MSMSTLNLPGNSQAGYCTVSALCLWVFFERAGCFFKVSVAVTCGDVSFKVFLQKRVQCDSCCKFMDSGKMPNKAQEDAVINMKTLQEISRHLLFEWPVLASELGFTRTEIANFHKKSSEKRVQARNMLETWYERSWDKPNKTKLLRDGLERAGRRDLAERLRCLHWGHQKLSRRVELPSAFPFLITVHKTIRYQREVDGHQTHLRKKELPIHAK